MRIALILVAFPFDTQSITKQTSDECGRYIVVKNATFDNYIDYKEKNIWKIYNVK